MDKYRETMLKAIREYEKQFDPVEQYEITYAIDIYPCDQNRLKQGLSNFLPQ